MKSWLILVYRIPREPTAKRVFVWQLKHLGAVAVQDAMWVLPANPRTLEQFQWLAAEITELGGSATLWQAEQIYATDAGALKRQFTEPVEIEYQKILAALRKKNVDLGELSRRYQENVSRDYFFSELAVQVRERLIAVQGERRR
ncbi:MAG: Chromate resistance protein ChrB [Planctomycetota bacterium]